MSRTNSKVDEEFDVRPEDLKPIPRRHLLTEEETNLKNCSVRVTMYLDADVLEHFKARGAVPDAAPYQTQINNELRRAMEHDQQQKQSSMLDYSKLLDDERFIAAVAERVKEHRTKA